MKRSMIFKLGFVAALPIIVLTSGCNSQHPESIHGIKLGRPAIEEFHNAAKAGKIEYLENGGAWMNLPNDTRGNITYSTFSDEKDEGLLESVSVDFFSQKIYVSPEMSGASYYTFRVTKDDESFIRNLFFEKYGVISEVDSVKDISDETINDNVYSIYRGDSWRVYTYAWLENDRKIILSLRSEFDENVAMATASYYFRKNYITSLKSKIKSREDDKKNAF